MTAPGEQTAVGPRGRLRTLVADDEPLARELLANLVRRDPELALVASAGSGVEALKAVQKHAPHLVLLDIQMPSLDGISVAEQLAGFKPAPYVIFVTAHDNFAVQAFEVAVRDYLVKPLSKRRFSAAIGRAKAALRGVRDADGCGPEIVVRSGERLLTLLPDDIVWVQAANQYSRLHTVGDGEQIVSRSLRQFARSLGGAAFTRIHRSTLINLSHLRGVQRSGARYQVAMSDGSLHDLARSRRSLLPGLLSRARENTAS